jgi:hypothetical protein
VYQPGNTLLKLFVELLLILPGGIPILSVEFIFVRPRSRLLSGDVYWEMTTCFPYAYWERERTKDKKDAWRIWKRHFRRNAQLSH